MDALQFAYWLQGFCELNQEHPTPEQWRSIRDHLSLVFVKVTPPMRAPAPPNVTNLDWIDSTISRKPLKATCKANEGGSSGAGGRC